MVAMGQHDYMMLGEDGRVVTVDLTAMVRRHQDAHIEARAALIDQAAALLGDETFSLEESYAAAEAAMPDGMVSSAAHIALTLAEVERYGLPGGG
jgi:hypothetical protein